MADGDAAREHEAARRLYDLALDFAERALRSQSNLIREFEAVAASSMAWVGAVVVDADDDENLILQADGHFAGRALDDETERWEAITSPDDVADHYDPVDLFADLADAIAEMFPGLELEVLKDAGMVASTGLEVWSDAPPEPLEARDFEASSAVGPERLGVADQTGTGAARDVAGTNNEQVRVLEDLMKAGVMSKEQFEAAKAKLRPS